MSLLDDAQWVEYKPDFWRRRWDSLLRWCFWSGRGHRELGGYCFDCGKTSKKEVMLAEYFEIDLEKCEQERRKILEEIRKRNR